MPALLARLIVALALGGCGRLGFDAQPDAADEDLPDPISAIVPRFSTTSDMFVDVPGGSITIPPSPGRMWLVLVSAGLQSDSFAEIAVEARYLVDGIERGYGGTQNSAIDRPGPWQHFYVHEGTDAAAKITVQLRELMPLATSTIDQLHIVAIPLPTAAAPLYASGDPIRDVVNSGYETQYDFTLEPARTDDYVFLLLANTSDAPMQGDIFTYWRGPDGQPWHPAVQNPRKPWQSHLFVRRATIGPEPTTVSFQATSVGGQIQYVRMLALRSAGFPSVELAEDGIERRTKAAAITIANQLSVTSSASRFLYLASSRTQPDCDTNLIIADRGNFFTVDDRTDSLIHATQNCAYMTTYGTVRLLPSTPRTLSIGFNSGNAEDVVYIGSSILLVGLD